MNILITEKKFTQICRENPCAEDIERLKQELFAKARKRKDAAKERSEKKVKNVTTTGDRETPYDLEKVLKTLGEVSLTTTILSSETFLQILMQVLY